MSFKGPFYICGKKLLHLRSLITFVEVFTFRGPTHDLYNVDWDVLNLTQSTDQVRVVEERFFPSPYGALCEQNSLHTNHVTDVIEIPVKRM